MRHGTHVAWQVVDGEAILVDLSSGRTIGLNAVGTAIWTHLPDASVRQLAERVADGFDVGASEAERDVRTFLDDLERRGLVAV